MPKTRFLIGLFAGLALTTAIAVLDVDAELNASPAQQDAAIGGYCPVAYLAMNTAVKGDPAYASEHGGLRFLLTNADAKAMFDAEPDKYVPAYNGWCATAIAQGMKLESDPTLFTVHDGRAYLFSNAEAKGMFDVDPAGTVATADAAWRRMQ